MKTAQSDRVRSEQEKRMRREVSASSGRSMGKPSQSEFEHNHFASLVALCNASPHKFHNNGQQQLRLHRGHPKPGVLRNIWQYRWHSQNNPTEEWVEKKCAHPVESMARLVDMRIHRDVCSMLCAFWYYHWRAYKHNANVLCFVWLSWKLMPLNEFHELFGIVYVCKHCMWVCACAKSTNLRNHGSNFNIKFNERQIISQNNFPAWNCFYFGRKPRTNAPSLMKHRHWCAQQRGNETDENPKLVEFIGFVRRIIVFVFSL